MRDRRKYLQGALLVFGVIALLLYPLMLLWSSGWAWTPGQHEYEQMIIGIYATLGVFLIWASRDPEAHLSLIWFTVWSSVVHGGIMGVQAIVDPTERGHLERQRADRRLGEARGDFHAVHRFAEYDVDIDATQPTEGNVTRLITAWQNAAPPDAI